MSRLLAPTDTMVEVDIEGARFGGTTRYRRGPDGAVHPLTAQHERALREQGFTPAGVARAGGRGGFECTGCGRRNWFRRCARCGGEGERL